MEFIAKLIPIDSPSKKNQRVGRSQLETYLKTDHYKIKVVDSKLAFFGITHKDRKVDGTYQGIGPDDQVLANRNTIGYIKEVFIEGNWAKGIIKLYNPDNFSGQVFNDIKYVEGLIKEGTLFDTSVILDAYWSSSYECKELLEIDGLDITKNPSFEGAGMEKIIKLTYD